MFFNSDRTCRNCAHYSINHRFCNLNKIAITPEKNCANFREMGFIDKAFSRFVEYTPKVMDTLMDTLQKAQEMEAQKQEEMEAYEAEYSRMSNQELQSMVDHGVSGTERAALASIAQERRNERERFQKLYSSMSTFDLKVEYKIVDTQKRYGELEEPIADLRLAIISTILKKRGWYLNQNLEWCEY